MSQDQPVIFFRFRGKRNAPIGNAGFTAPRRAMWRGTELDYLSDHSDSRVAFSLSHLTSAIRSRQKILETNLATSFVARFGFR